MKILFIAPSNSIHSKKWIEFHSRNNKIVWVSFYKKTYDINNDIDYLQINSLKSFLLNFFLFYKHLNSSDIIHQHYIGRLSWVILFFTLNKYIISPWGSDIKFTKKNSLKGIIIKKLFKKAMFITLDADYMNYHVLKFGHFSNKIRRINFGTDTKIFEFKKLNQIKNNNKFKIISLRNLEKIYCVEDLILAINLLPKNIQNNLSVFIYGEGREKENLNLLTDKYGLKQIITFKGKYNYKLLPNILSKANLYVSTSSSDAGLAASTSEAMSSGTLVLCSDNSENSYWLKENGLLYKTNDFTDLSNKILKAIKMSNKSREKLILNARKKIVQENDFTNEMKKMENIYG